MSFVLPDVDSDDEDYMSAVGSVTTDAAPKIPLEDAIDLSKLTSGEGFTFTTKESVDPEEILEEIQKDNDEIFFSSEDMLKVSRPRECLGIGDAEDDSDTPFQKLAKKMTPVEFDGKLMKLLIKEGTGDLIPDGALVTFNYSVYHEHITEPFDSSFFRIKPTSIHVGRGNLIGLDLALQTMKAGEESQFLVHYDLAYGVLGCPPRIPPKSTLLYEIKVEKFLPPSVVNAIENMAELEQDATDNPTKFMAAKAFCAAGKEMFDRKLFGAAAMKFVRATRIMEGMKDMDEEMQDEWKPLLLKQLVNAAVSYNYAKDHEKALENCRKALKIDSNHAKANFHYGRAKFLLEEYRDAKYYLKKAHKLAPTDTAITSELVKLEEKLAELNIKDSELATKMMSQLKTKADSVDSVVPELKKLKLSSTDSSTSDEPIKKLSDEEYCEFGEKIKAKIDRFIKSKNRSLDFPFIEDKYLEGIVTHFAMLAELNVQYFKDENAEKERLRVTKKI